jgi:hypothetical protein
MSLIAEIKKAVPLAPWIAPYTNGLKPSGGRNFMIGDCPVCHKRRTFWVYLPTQTCGCFIPACPAYCNWRKDHTSKPLDIINIYAIIHGITNRQAIHELAVKAGLPNE